MLCTLGDLIEDVVVWLGEPTNHASDTASRIDRTRGGSAANVAYFAAATGIPSRFVGQVGADHLGDHLVETLRHAGVDVVARHGGRTGCVVVIVQPGGERTMLTDRGSAVDLDQIESSVLDGVRTLHVPMYSLATGRLATTARRLIELAHERRITVSIDASSVSVLESYGVDAALELFRELAPTVLLCNDDEARTLGLTSAPQGIDTVIIKRGARPVQVMDSSGVREIELAPIPRVVDTTGAGDAFAAGFLGALSSGRATHEAVVAGHALAIRALGSAGATLDSMEARP